MTTENTVETKKFDAEVGKVLDLMIHALYTNKEIFLRELISNASDACDKLRYMSVSDQSLIADNPEFKIIISVNKERREVRISDNGVGMNKQDLITHLGTIAKSGTEAFAKHLTGDQKKDTALIGQFGVGFYSTYMIADGVKVISRKAGEDETYVWNSDGLGEYTVQKGEATKGETRDIRGTEVIVHVKEGEDEYLDHFRLKNIAKTYSNHISVPIYFSEDDKEVKLNSSSAIWRKNKSDVSQEEYKEFYKSVSFSPDDPYITIHNRNEGNIEFTNLLFVPSDKTFDLFHPDRKRRVKLYVKRVFITDENIDLVPRYFRFVRGVIDCDTLPLNISRETLQHNAIIDKINNNVTNKILSELKNKKENDRENYEKFWNNFGAVIKEGLCEPGYTHEKILDICLFKSALHGKMMSLQEYVDNFTENQKEIYYLSGDDAEKLKNSPQIEGFLKKNIDVLLFSDTTDDFWVNVVSKFKDFDIKSATREDIDLDQYSSEEKPQVENVDKIISIFKETLGELVKDVKISKKLESVPACLVVGEGAMDIRMERFLIEQKQLHSSSAKILEINPGHRIIQKLSHDLDSSDSAIQESNKELVKLVFDQACVIENEPLNDPAGFCRRINQFINI